MTIHHSLRLTRPGDGTCHAAGCTDEAHPPTSEAGCRFCAPYIKNGTVLFPQTGCEQPLAQVFNFGVESHDGLMDGLPDDLLWPQFYLTPGLKDWLLERVGGYSASRAWVV
jgi:hypothetical protein